MWGHPFQAFSGTAQRLGSGSPPSGPLSLPASWLSSVAAEDLGAETPATAESLAPIAIHDGGVFAAQADIEEEHEGESVFSVMINVHDDKQDLATVMQAAAYQIDQHRYAGVLLEELESVMIAIGVLISFCTDSMDRGAEVINAHTCQAAFTMKHGFLTTWNNIKGDVDLMITNSPKKSILLDESEEEEEDDDVPTIAPEDIPPSSHPRSPDCAIVAAATLLPPGGLLSMQFESEVDEPPASKRRRVQ